MYTFNENFIEYLVKLGEDIVTRSNLEHNHELNEKNTSVYVKLLLQNAKQ